MYFEALRAKDTASLFETPDFNYGVPYTPHPKPATPFIRLAHLQQLPNSLITLPNG